MHMLPAVVKVMCILSVIQMKAQQNDSYMSLCNMVKCR